MSWQPCRRMKGNKANEMPENFVFVDCETIPDYPFPDDAPAHIEHKLRLGVAVGYRRRGDTWGSESWLEFTSADVFWAWLTRWIRPRSPVWVFAHNADYDMCALELTRKVDEQWLKLTTPPRRPRTERTDGMKPARDWRGMFVTDDKPWIVIGVCPAGLVTIVDSMNYLPTSLAKIGLSIGKPKRPMPKMSATDADWFAYCRRDVEILSDSMRGLMSKWRLGNCGNWQWTAGRLAMTNFKHNYKGPEILIHARDDVKELERASYVGGEIRHWYQGLYDGPVHSVDVRGNYACAMLEGSFPRRLIYSTIGETSPRSFDPVWASQSVAHVVLDTFEDHYPKRDGIKVTWPRGKFATYLAGDELRNAFDNGFVTEVIDYATYELFPIFRDYVDRWWSVRRQAIDQGDCITDNLAKMMLVNLYGKWAAMKPKWNLCESHPEWQRWGHFLYPDPETGKPARHRGIGGSFQREGKRGEKSDTFVAIASFVTAAARLRVRNVRLQLPDNSVLLQQTDGMLLTEAGWQSLAEMKGIVGHALGSYRLVESHEWADVSNANWQLYPNGAKFAGVPSRRFRNDRGTWSACRASRLSEQCATGPTDRIAWNVQDVCSSRGPAWETQASGNWRTVSEVSPINEYLMNECP